MGDLGTLQKASCLMSRLDDRTLRRAEQLRAEGRAQGTDAIERDELFTVRQRRQDVATQVAVTVQAYLSMSVFADNKTKLQQGVERALTTTVAALRTAVITAQALGNQKIALDQIDAVNATTDGIDAFRAQANQNFLTTVTSLEQPVQRAQPYLERMQKEQIEKASAMDLLGIEDRP